MFLFTTLPSGPAGARGPLGAPPAPTRAAPADGAPASPVTQAIREGAQATGTSFDYLLATARRESALDPGAKARTSSATGLFQFIEQTWLGTVKTEGARLGLGPQADQITVRADGSYTVEDPAARKAILDLRQDPKVAATMAGALTQRNRAALAAETGREPGDGDLYLAHFLGARGASTLIRAAEAAPTRAAAADFPEAAAANRSIFYDRAGRARGAAEVYALLGAAHGASASAPSSASATPSSSSQAASSQAADRAVSAGPSFHGLFQTEGRRGPVSDAVARVWRTGGGGETQVAALRYFPRSSATDAASSPPEPASAEAASPAQASTAADVPLPPSRPEAPAASPRRAAPLARRAPLDLSTFMGPSRS